MNQLHTLKMNINKDIDFTPVLTFQALADHYCQTELLAENKAPKTRKKFHVQAPYRPEPLYPQNIPL